MDDESIGYAARSLRQLRAEIMRRIERLKSLDRQVCPDKRTTGQIAAKRSLRLWPVVCIVDEAQNLFAHPSTARPPAPTPSSSSRSAPRSAWC